ncbi:hypothetical protein JMA_39180 (plasmid) [Jeotgalibacillus malaysiensis]|uniref:Polymer-forming cytoskeletal protein n=1 Tax=Jeotgalibacillus malaysiensis TaxID=1508404 RepID=A0A0B5ASY7_9BACL|nr:hypothetical protein [Jeotgalibacillus malaysiensis]AJD93236.1 hypothetical protein JMA_39180 [Jeotgalibacillus malaysiensis]
MNEQKKYKMVKEDSGKLYRIQALIDIPEHFVEAGDFGGLIQSEINLSQFGDGWIEKEAMVTDDATVKAGVIKGKSYLKDEVVVYSGVISDSTLSGKTIIKGRTKVSSSTLWNCSIMNGDIVSSELYNVDIENGSGVVDSSIRSSEKFRIEDAVLIKKSNLRTSSGLISGYGLMHYANINANSILISSKFALKNVNASISDIFWIRESKNEHLPGMSEVIGADNGVEEPVFIETSSLTLKDSSIRGSVKLHGTISLVDSTVSDMSQISMRGKLEACNISEMAMIEFNPSSVVTLRSLRLGGEEVYNNEALEQLP